MFILPSFATGIATNTGNAPCDNATLSKYNGTADIEINWEPNVIGLNWYDGDTKLSVQQSAQSCVYDSTLTVPQQPTKPGYTFNGWKVIHVPGGYTELQYIEGGLSYGAYMDLGFPATPTMQTLLMASLGQTVDNQQVIFGASDNMSLSEGNAYAIDVLFEKVLLLNGGYNSINIALSQDVIYQFKINYPNVGQVGINDTIVPGVTNLSSVSSNNIHLFTCKYPTTTSSFPPQKMKLYKLTFWDKGTMIHNFIPAKRNSDNLVGLWDSVSQTFNSGTGTFVAGPVVGQ